MSKNNNKGMQIPTVKDTSNYKMIKKQSNSLKMYGGGSNVSAHRTGSENSLFWHCIKFLQIGPVCFRNRETQTRLSLSYKSVTFLNHKIREEKIDVLNSV